MIEEERRFEQELEFIQCLANPFYLLYLAQQGYLNDARFIRYLTYLRYWQQPAYTRYVHFPQALEYLGRLTSDAQFRQDIKKIEVALACLQQQQDAWKLERNPSINNTNSEGGGGGGGGNKV